MIDDQLIESWRGLQHVYPAQADRLLNDCLLND